ncbi:MAG: DUF4293 domain-containing protein, partial [Bacteroidetes bacterium]|nr:DUF4293 domain-containing protein [Bacteroidota bacterium]
VFLYRKRMLQVRLGIINIVLMAGFYGLGFLYMYTLSADMNAIVHYTLPDIFPLISIILTIMANRSIRKDERLVRAADRIR